MKTTSKAVAAGLAILVTGILTTPAALAAASRATNYNGASMCAAALPAGQPQISVRPYGIYNNGPNANFVSCSFPIERITDINTDVVAGTTGPLILIALWNLTSLSRTVNCSVTGGTRDGTGNISAASNLSVVMAAGSKEYVVSPYLDRKTQYGIINVSCLLPPGVELHQVNVYQYDVGNEL